MDKQKKQQEAQAQEINTLRGRASLSQQNWVKERDELISREAFAREEYEQAKQAMQDWEVLAMEERSLRENLTEKVAELEEQLSAVRDAHERSALDRDSQSQAVDGLQRALREIQEGMSSASTRCKNGSNGMQQGKRSCATWSKAPKHRSKKREANN